MKPVALDIDDKMFGTQLYEHFGGDKHARKVVTEESETNRCTPIAVHQLMLGKRSKKKGLSCQVCYFEGRGNNIVRNVVAWVQHRVRACTTSREDRKLTKTDGSDVIDYSWRAPMPGASCWDKMHKFYIPHGLFRMGSIEPMPTVNEHLAFQCCSVSSKLYTKKREALGENPIVHRGRRRPEKETGNYDAGLDENDFAKATKSVPI